MKLKIPNWNIVRLVAALVVVVGALVVWPALSHSSWRAGRPALHAVPAFFVGCLALVVAGGLIRSAVGCRAEGLRWSISRDAGATALVTLAGAGTVVALFYNVELWRGKRAFSRVAQQAEALAEPLDLRALRPAPAPEEANCAAAEVFKPLWDMQESLSDSSGASREPELGRLAEFHRRGRAFGLASDRSSPWMRGHYRDLDTGYSTPEPSRESAGRALSELAALEELLTQVKQASVKPTCQFAWSSVNPLFSDRIAAIEQVFTGLLLVLEQRAVAELRMDDAAAAFDDLRAGLRLASHLHRQPPLFYTGSRVQATAALLQPLWEGLAEHRWTAVQLAELLEHLETFDPAADLPARLRFQILTHTDLVESVIPTGKAAGAGLPWHDTDRAIMSWIRLLYPRGWSLQDQAALHAVHLDTMEKIVSEPGGPSEPEQRLAHRLLRRSSDPFFGVFLVPKAVQMTQDNHEFLLFEQTVLNLARSAVALELYKLTRGEYPEQLTSLVPAYLADVPSDPVSGRPLRYRLEPAGGFVIYSVGMDGQDDGGTPPPAARLGGPRPPSVGSDWPWPQSATNPGR